MPTFRHFRHLLAATSVALSCGLAQANLVTNGGFEAGNLSGWTAFGDIGQLGVSLNNPHNGLYNGAFGPIQPGGIFQTLATVAGASYDVEFWLRIEPGISNINSFEFNWDGGAAEYALLDVNPGFATFHFQLTAASASTDLRFTFMNRDAFFSLDDVIVNGRDVTLPEPASLPLVGLAGVAAVAGARRAKRRFSAPSPRRPQ